MVYRELFCLVMRIIFVGKVAKTKYSGIQDNNKEHIKIETLCLIFNSFVKKSSGYMFHESIEKTFPKL